MKKVKGKYEYPIRGRDLPTVPSNDLAYNPKHSAVTKQDPRFSIGKSPKFFDLNMKEVKVKPGPNSFRPKD